MKASQSLITVPHRCFDVAVLTPEVSNSLQHRFDSKFHVASSVFPVLCTTLKKKMKSKPLRPLLPIGVWARNTKGLLPIAAGA